jgi:hypothetical protein
MTDEPAPRGRRSAFLTFFTTLPGLLTAVATLLTAVTGLIVVISKLDGGGGDGDGGRGLPAVVGPSEQVYRSGGFTLQVGDMVDLDRGTSGKGLSSAADWLVPARPDPDWVLFAPYGARFAPLPGTGPASRDACESALRGRQDENYVVTPASKGRWVCVSTNDHRTAAFRVDRVSADPLEVGVTYVVWRSPGA